MRHNKAQQVNKQKQKKTWAMRQRGYFCQKSRERVQITKCYWCVDGNGGETK